MTAAPAEAGQRVPGGPSLALLLVLAAGFLPVLAAFGVGLWSKPAYRFFPLGLIAAGVLCWLGARRQPAERRPGAAWLTAGLLGVALVALAAATLQWSPWVGAFAALLAMLAVANWVGGRPLLQAWLPGWLVLLTLLPWPLGLDERILAHLRGDLLALARPLLGRLDVLHVVRGSGLEVPGKVVPLADATAGLYLIPAGVALALVLTTLLRRGWLHSVVVALTMPVWAFLGTLLWLVFGLKLAAGGGVDFFSGLAGAGATFFFLLVLAGLALSMDQFVWFWAAPSRSESSNAAAVVAARPPRRVITSNRLGWAAAAAFAVLGLVQAALAAREFLAPTPGTVVAAIPTLASPTLPGELAGWRQFTNRFSGQDDLVTPTAGAQTWQFARGELAASITLEQPLVGYQELVGNYSGAGWRVLRVAGFGEGTNQAAPFVAADLQKEIFQFGRVWFAVGEASGKWLAAPRTGGRPGLLRTAARAPLGPTFRIQLFVSSLEALTAAEVESAESLFQAARQQLAAQLATQPLVQDARFQSQ